MITVIGHSDDVIEIGGDWNDELNSFNTDTEITFDDGTVLLMQYDGAWKAKVLVNGNAEHTVQKVVNNGDYYSDLFTIETSGISGVKQKYLG